MKTISGKALQMSEKNRVKLKICGNEFYIVSQDSEEYIHKVAEQVDHYLNDLMRNSATMSTTMASVFAALEFCDRSIKATETADQLREQIQTYLKEANDAKSEAAELRRREIELERENITLRAKLEKADGQV